MDHHQIVKALRRIQRWLAEGDTDAASLDLKHLLDTIDPDYREETMVDQLFTDLASALKPDITF